MQTQNHSYRPPGGHIPAAMRREIAQLIDERISQVHATRHDFTELKNTVESLTQNVKELSQAQMRTEKRLDSLEAAIKELAESQARGFEELSQAQMRTEKRVDNLEATVKMLAESQARGFEELAQAQMRTEKRVDNLEATVKMLAETQARGFEELAQAQMRAEKRMDGLDASMKGLAESQARGFEELSNRIAALGGRWGIYNEATFRATLQGIFAKMDGVDVREGFYGDRQVDVVIRNGDHILLEITSRMHARDIESLYRSAEDYEAREGVRPQLMVATSYVSPRLMQKIMNLERKIDIFSYEGEE